eukprot:TRINITY_DN13381_c0_g1_i1.p1 TRINITY_DN13381_c0_g1~~TRINITY_DN13381_c0_g1_i1.p1  ORF type:complete len:228 (-),score=58.64 TRINITY_DN13381_c0_g1_i1:143-826(-)
MWCCCYKEEENAGEIKVVPVTPQAALTEAVEPPATEEEPSVTVEKAFAKVRPASFEFDVKLTLPHGISIDFTCDEFAIIKDQLAAGASLWNSSAVENEKIRAFDRIKKVNGLECKDSNECKALLEAVSGSVMSLTLQRPVERELVMKKTGSLGLNVNYKGSSASIWIAGITDGHMQQWNKEHPDQAVIVKDRITGVNGVTGDVSKVLASLKDAQETVVVTVLSYNMP